MSECFDRCLCSTCTNNDTCRDGCELCGQLHACRFVISRGKCTGYSPDNEAIAAALLAAAREVTTNGKANANGRN